MDIIRKITELSFQPGSVKEFSEFVGTVHTDIKCTKQINDLIKEIYK